MYAWLAHSNYSFLQGASYPRELVEAASEHGWWGMGITDFDGFYGIVQTHLAGKDNPHPLHLFYGAEVLIECPVPETLRSDSAAAQLWDAPQQNSPVFLQNRVAFFATSKESYAQLCQLLSYAHRNGKLATALNLADPHIPWPRETLVLWPMRGMQQLFAPRQSHCFAAWSGCVRVLAEKYKGHFFLALTPPSTPFERHAFANHLACHRQFGWPLVATPDVFFHSPDRKELHDILTAIRLNRPVDSLKWACFANSRRCLAPLSHFETEFPKVPEVVDALENNKKIAGFFQFSLSELRYQYPSKFIPAGHTSESFLEYLLHEALHNRYNGQPPERMMKLVQKEMKLVRELKFADYFLTVWDIVRFAREQKILCQGRGSSANSAICFLLGITAVDPMVSDVLFERFISHERGEPPDIDVDFEHERREEVIQYIYSHYGRGHAAMVANVITFRTRGATRFVGKALGLSDDELTETQSPEFTERWQHFIKLIKGFPRHLGIHSGGFVISHEPLHMLSPVEPATMPGRSVVQWCKDDIEALGLFKIDVLALGMLTALRKTFFELARHRVCLPGTLIPIQLATIPSECSKTYDMICEARTTGVFQIESRAQMSMLPKVKPRTFYDIVIQVGIVRPGPIVSGIVPTYVRRKRGLEKVTYAHPSLQRILHRTLGVPVFQEQVMRIAMAVGNFSGGEADELRRAMGAWKFTGRISQFEEKLRSGMKQNGIPDDFADLIYSQIEGFSQYGFPESHATSFAHLAYASCWLKAHFPIYFLAGLLNSQPLGFYSPHSLIQEAKHAGLTVYPPCILRSGWEHYVTRQGALQLGFSFLRGITEERARDYVAQRQELLRTRTLSLHDVIALCDCFYAHEKILLAQANCFEVFDSNRRNILWLLLARPSALMPDVDHVLFPEKPTLHEAWDNMQDDFASSQSTFGPHPMLLLRNIGWPYTFQAENLTSAITLRKKRHKTQVVVAGLIMVRQMPGTAKGMMFITLEDETGTMNLVFRPDTHAQYKEWMTNTSVLCVRGWVQENGPNPSVLVTEVFPAVHQTKLPSPPPDGLEQDYTLW
ncbi:error-prone DNA polymerase [bacterium]|nr:error-prone DNA polymerase [bacterium]